MDDIKSNIIQNLQDIMTLLLQTKDLDKQLKSLYTVLKTIVIILNEDEQTLWTTLETDSKSLLQLIGILLKVLTV